MDRLPHCDSCGAESESIYHALFDCTWAQLFWEELKKVTEINIPNLHPRSWSSDLISGDLIPLSDACVILCGCWAVWSERNARRHGEGGRNIIGSVRWALDTTYDLAQFGKNHSPTPIKTLSSWKKPDDGVLKINVDVSYTREDGTGATGVVVRDAHGSMIRAQANWTGHDASPMVMEALAILEGVRLAVDQGYQKVEIESDAQQVIKLIEDPGGTRSCIATIRQDIEELSGNFSSFKLLFANRQANEAAHLCARRASRVRRRCLWVNYIPPFLLASLAKDCSPD